jgi:hypothetical protein
MGSAMITDPAAPGGVIEAKLILGIDNHFRYLVIAKVVPRATAQAVCTAFVAALAEHGVPEEVFSDIQTRCRPFGTRLVRPALSGSRSAVRRRASPQCPTVHHH